jgi:uncharacterized membrane protein YcaP (DUF421 family)
MDIVLRSAAVYLALLVVFRIAGRRSFAQITTFDIVLLLIIGEATQQALLGDDFSVTNGVLVVVSLVVIDIGLATAKATFPFLQRTIEGVPVVLVEHGRPMRDRMRRSQVDEPDILEAARQTHGLERFDQIRYAVLERSGEISIVPESGAQ